MIITTTKPFNVICYGCEFYQWSHPDYWPIGKCTNPKSRARRKDPRYATDRSCAQKVTAKANS